MAVGDDLGTLSSKGTSCGSARRDIGMRGYGKLRSVRVSAAALHPFPLGIESMPTNVSQQNDRRDERVGSTGSRRVGTISGERDRRATACSEDDSTSSADHRRLAVDKDSTIAPQLTSVSDIQELTIAGMSRDQQ